MSSHGNATSMRDALYEAPGPKTKRKIMVGTAVSAVVVACILLAILGRFYATGQLDPRYWTFFFEWSTWRFLLQGFAGTVRAWRLPRAPSRWCWACCSRWARQQDQTLSAACRVVIDFFPRRSQPAIDLHFFFGGSAVRHQDVLLDADAARGAWAASGVLAEVFRAGVNAVPRGQVEAAMSIGLSPAKTMRKIVLRAVRLRRPSPISQLVVVVWRHHRRLRGKLPDLMQNARVLITSCDDAGLRLLHHRPHLYPHQLRHQQGVRRGGQPHRRRHHPLGILERKSYDTANLN